MITGHYTLEAITDNAAKFVPRPFLYTKRQWADTWTFREDFIVESATFCAGGQDLDTLIFRRKYGLHIPPWGTEAEFFEPLESMEGTWIRLGLEKPNSNGETSEDFIDTVWVGQIVCVKPEPQGSSASGVYGEQIFTCYGPAFLLRKIHVTQSFWDIGEESGEESEDTGEESEDDGEESKLAWCQWLPTPNDFNGEGIGNRSENQSAISEDEGTEETYLFGKSGRWTCGQFARYLIYRIAPNSGLQWSITGSALETLDEMDLRAEWCHFGDVVTLWDMLHTIIRTDCGIDFFVRFNESVDKSENESGSPAEFEIVVFSLVADDVIVGDASFPRNPDRLQVISGGGQDFLKVDLINSDEYHYSKIRLYGDRIISCMTLWGENSDIPWDDVDVDTCVENTLFSLWSDILESEYRYAVGDEKDEDDPDNNDTERMDSYYSKVFRRFGANKDIDLLKSNVLFEGIYTGVVNPVEAPKKGQPKAYQLCDRKTEDFVPFALGEKTVSWYQFNNDKKEKKKTAKPLVWIKAYEDEEEATDDENFLYRPVNELGFSVAPLDDWIGVSVEGKPPHILAGDKEWDGSETAVDPQYDWRTMVATVAFKTDQRVYIERSTGDSGGTLEEVYPNVQCWVVPPGTAYAYKNKGFIVPKYFVVTRTDHKELEPLLAAKIARYKGRGKAVVEMFAARNMTQYLGMVLTLVIEDDLMHKVNAPVTEIRLTFSGGASRTVISAGYPT